MFDDDPRLNPEKLENAKVVEPPLPVIKSAPKPPKQTKTTKQKKQTSKQKVEYKRSKVHQRTGQLIG